MFVIRNISQEPEEGSKYYQPMFAPFCINKANYEKFKSFSVKVFFLSSDHVETATSRNDFTEYL